MRTVPACLLAAAMALGACAAPAIFAVPISEPAGIEYDERLIGNWHYMPGDSPGVMTMAIEEGEEEGTLDLSLGLISIEAGPDGEKLMARAEGLVHASDVGGQTYYNLRVIELAAMVQDDPEEFEARRLRPELPDEDFGYLIAVPEFETDDRLILHLIAEKHDMPRFKVPCGEDCVFDMIDMTSNELATLIWTTQHEELFAVQFPYRGEDRVFLRVP